MKLVVVGDKLMVMQDRTHRIFYFFSLPEMYFLYSWGRGGGPEDFISPFESTISTDDKGFGIWDPPNYKYISLEGEVPVVESRELINGDFFNSFAKIDSSTFVYNGKHNAKYEFVIADKKNGTTKEFDNTLISKLEESEKEVYVFKMN